MPQQPVVAYRRQPARTEHARACQQAGQRARDRHPPRTQRAVDDPEQQREHGVEQHLHPDRPTGPHDARFPTREQVEGEADVGQDFRERMTGMAAAAIAPYRECQQHEEQRRDAEHAVQVEAQQRARRARVARHRVGQRERADDEEQCHPGAAHRQYGAHHRPGGQCRSRHRHDVEQHHIGGGEAAQGIQEGESVGLGHAGGVRALGERRRPRMLSPDASAAGHGLTVSRITTGTS